MKFLILYLYLISQNTYSQSKLADEVDLKRSDLIIAEKIVALMKVSDQGYFNASLTNKLKADIAKSKNFTPFSKWIEGIITIHSTKESDQLSQYCNDFTQQISALPLEQHLEQKLSTFCREKALELIGREVDKKGLLPEYAFNFIKANLKYFLNPQHKKSFSYFLQNQESRPEIIRKLSMEITDFSIRNQITPSHEVLQDILIDDKITSLIQAKGFQPLEHKNVFYTEFGKLIELGYKILNAQNVDEKKLNKHFENLKNYFQLNVDYLPNSLALTRINDFSKASFRLGYPDLARKMLTFIISQKDKENEFDAYYFYLWTYIHTNDQKNAVKYIKKENLVERVAIAKDSQLRYWIAYVFEKDGNTKEAIALYEATIADNPLSYYAITSSKRLLSLKPDSTLANFYHNDARKSVKISTSLSDFDPDHLASLVRLKAWSTIDSGHMIDLELRRLNNYSLPLMLQKKPLQEQNDLKEVIHLLQAKIIQSSQNYLMTFRYIYNLLDNKEVSFSRNVLDLLFPRPFLEVLKKNLKGEDPLLVLSLIRQESVFNPQARSPVGARGLMQLMPATARQMRRSVQVKQLSNPAINIELGTKYFQGLMKRYSGNLVYVLSAYNAGESRVTRWRKEYFDEEETIVRNVETIPFKETRTYVKLIYRNLFFYKLLTSDELVDNKENNKIFNVEFGFKR